MAVPDQPIQDQGTSRGGYSRKVIRGSGWNIGGSIYGYVLILVRGAVLARLLLPEHFGPFAKVLVAVTVLDAVTFLGLESVVVQAPQLGKKDLDSFWTLNALRGIVVGLALYLGAPLFSRLLAQESLTLLIRWASIAPVLSGLSSPRLHLLSRHLRFGRQVAGGIASATVALTATCLIAYRWPGAGALVAGYVISAGLRMLMSHIVAPYFPRPALDLRQVWQHLRFGLALAWLQMVSKFCSSLDKAVVGRVVGERGLGLYAMAFNTVTLPITRFSIPINQAVFAAFCRLQDQSDRLAQAMARTVRVLGGVACPAMIGISLLSRETVYLYLGTSWSGAAPLVSLLALAGALQVVTAPLARLIIATGHPKKLLAVRALEVPLYAVALVLLTIHYSTLGAAWATLALFGLRFVLFLALTSVVQPEAGRLSAVITLVTLSCCAVMALAVHGCLLVIPESLPVCRAIAGVAVGVIAYGLATVVINRRLFSEARTAWQAIRPRAVEPPASS